MLITVFCFKMLFVNHYAFSTRLKRPKLPHAAAIRNCKKVVGLGQWSLSGLSDEQSQKHRSPPE